MTITLGWDLLAWAVIVVVAVYVLMFTWAVLVFDPNIPEWLVPALGWCAVLGAVTWAVLTVAT